MVAERAARVKGFNPPDKDAINCLTPALALFKAGKCIPGIPAKDAIPATSTTNVVQ